MTGSFSDMAQNWLSLLELFESASGLKLRINLLDTILIHDGRIFGWFYTSRDGVVVRASNHEISSQAVFHKLAGMQSANLDRNPFNYVALAHYDSGISRPLKQNELHQMLQGLCGPLDMPYQPEDSFGLFCIQAYINPIRDLRYISCFGEEDGMLTCTTFARRYSLRYTHAFDDPSIDPHASPKAIAAHAASKAAASAASAARALIAAQGSDAETLTTEEMLVESQLVAAGLLEPRETAVGERKGSFSNDLASSPDASSLYLTPEAALPAPKAVKAEIQRTIQTILSFVERAHGLRIQGLVAEFLQPAPDTIMLAAVHAVQWDSRSSKGRLGTFTERWGDFLSGMGPPPAVRPTSRRSFAPSSNSALDHLGSPRPGSASGRGYPMSQNNNRGNETTRVIDVRPGSAPTRVMQRYRPNPYYPSPIANSQQGRVQSARRTSATIPTTSAAPMSSYTLWTSREQLPTETVAGSLTLEVELLRERLQRQTDAAARAESALTQLALGQQATHASLLSQVESLKSELSTALNEKEAAEKEYERLRAERPSLKMEISNLQAQLSRVRAAIEDERTTLSMQVRTSLAKDEQMTDLVQNVRAENEVLTQQVTALQRKVEESSEVIDAVKMQLVDYKTMVMTLQGQLRRGKGKMISMAGPNNAVQKNTASLGNLGAGSLGRDGELLESTEWMTAGMMESSTGGRQQGTTPIRPGSANGSSTPIRPPTIRHKDLGRLAPNIMSPSTRQRGVNTSSYLKREKADDMSDSVQDQALFSKNSISVVEGHIRAAPVQPAAGLPGSTDQFNQYLQEVRRARVNQALAEVSQVVKEDTGIVEDKQSDEHKLAIRAHEPWRPNYHTLIISDLFVIGGEIGERTSKIHSAVINMIKVEEEELLDIFNFYVRLKRVRTREGSLSMCCDQFVALSKDVGVQYQDFAEDVFHIISDKSKPGFQNTTDDLSGFFHFDYFPEAMIRMAAIMYDWRIPENDEEVDTEMEIPESLMRAMEGLENTNNYSTESSSIGREPGLKQAVMCEGRPWLPGASTSRPSSGTNTSHKIAPASSSLKAALPAALQSAPKVADIAAAQFHLPEQVLMMIMRTFLYHDLLPKARRWKTAGSPVSKHRSQLERTAPPDVWRL
ncbi:hypothetical protein CEUSTIGMA_g1532.t1 [Chlamydomonas eustigma]|uniref:Uncharacterized protein n=1 Tax=Chlamydomonas eustigma TaxID=1157962 RepID=A0A250WTW7_9CHLO|nr:hypothetical protein CEUSTIGMA_g1532.t1 [Chlamydomonas eustigma]|eukprot:GAX74082.1 hypothetical protein CEUSTIGMA_g1532.t1 [Chlamydomonas eustigma]